MILNSPGNPTGGVIPKADLTRIADLVRDRDLIVLSDEIYSRICYDERAGVDHAVRRACCEKTIILDGFSKTYSMTGWRLGYGVMPQWLVDAVERLMVNSNSCTASFTQRAGMAALQGPQDCVDAMVAEFRRRRDAIVAGLNAIPGFRCTVAGRRVLRVSRTSPAPACRQQGAGRPAAERGRRGVPERHRVRRVRRRLPALQLRQLAREHRGSADAHTPRVLTLDALRVSAPLSDFGRPRPAGGRSERPCPPFLLPITS